MTALRDRFGRRIYYLRLSVTDRCNLRCVYCLPEHYSPATACADLMSDDEIVSLMACFSSLGISKIRITGGEPLVRPGVTALVDRLARVPGVSGLSFSTNGVLPGRGAS